MTNMGNRQTPVTPGQCWVSRAAQSPFHLITSPRMKVSVDSFPDSSPSTHTSYIGEKARISAAGGFVDFGRVNGNLALSRAIGDFEFKKSPELSPEQQIVTAYPDVTVHEVTQDDEFLVIACDGMSSRFNPTRVPILIYNFRYLGLPVLSSCG